MRSFSFKTFSSQLRHLLILTLLSIGTASGSLIFNDAAFDDSQWSAASFGTGGFSFTAAQQASGGNTGSFRRVDHDVTGPPVSMRVVHLRNDASYTPILEGEIVSLDFSIDFLNIDIFGQGQNFGVAILQNGNYYYGSSQITAPGGAIWTPGTATNLGAVDFIEILADASTNNSSHPDFSITGSTIIFGFTTANITGFSGSIDVGYDNWSVSHAAVVPEPSTSFVFFAFAFYGICSRPRRRRALG